MAEAGETNTSMTAKHCKLQEYLQRSLTSHDNSLREKLRPAQHLLFGCECDLGLRRLAGGDHHGLRLLARGLVPHHQGVGARRHILDGEVTVGAGCRVVRMLELHDPRVHPLVCVALDLDEPWT